VFEFEREWQNRLEILTKIINASSKISLSGFSTSPGAHPMHLSSQHKKGFKDIVTEFDQKVEDFLVSQLKENFPNEAVLGEEGAYKLAKKPNDETFSGEEVLWVLDPIDGTANYSRSYPYFCTTISLLQKKDKKFKPVLAITLDPVRKELFTAALGKGAFMNGEKIRVSEVDSLQTSMFVTGFASDISANKDIIFRRFSEMTRKTLGVRRTGAAALDLAYVAMGRLDAYWECSLSVWDVAAGALLVREAGGTVSHFERSDEWIPWTGEILAANSKIHDTVLKELQKIS
jgi:myo-inositol-1(or 4)-monophosphatase